MTIDSSPPPPPADRFWSFDIYPQIIQPFLEELLYLRIPIFVALLSFFLFSSLDQTLDVYLAFALDEPAIKIFLSTVFVFLLSGFTWYSARYLAEKRVADFGSTVLQQHYANRGARESPQPFVRYAFLWGAAFILGLSSLTVLLRPITIFCLIGLWLSNFLWVFHQKESWIIEFSRWILSRIRWIRLELQGLFRKRSQNTISSAEKKGIKPGTEDQSRANALIYIPRFLGIIPLLSFGLGWSNLVIEKSDLFTDGQQLIWATGYSTFIIYILTPLFIFLTENRKKPEKIQHDISNDDNLKIDENDSLFDDKFEIILFIISFVIFASLTIPMLKPNLFLGIAGVTGLLALMYLLLFLWNRDENGKVIYGGIMRLGGLISLAISAISFFFIPPVFLPKFVGPIVVISLFLICFLFIANTIFYWGKLHNFPATGVLIALIFITSAFNLNDNHRFTSLNLPQNWQPLPPLEESFQQWFDQREQERETFEARGEAYPVYIVSAQGGGIYAAYHTAAALSRLQDRFPSFADHVFAISSVSGGSVGATTFSSLVKSQVCDRPDRAEHCLESKAKQILGQDLLSPLLSFGLFPDLVQRFPPFPLYDWDRARGLDAAFESAWDRVIPTREAANPLKQSFYNHWDTAHSTPALVLNTTMVGSGKRLVISPFNIQLPQTFPTLKDLRTYNDEINPKLSTAAGLSARFPIVTPVGWFEDKRQTKYRLADGGYFDNSGLLTALDLGQALQGYIQAHQLKAKLIYLSIIDQPPTPTVPRLTAQAAIAQPAGAINQPPTAQAAGLNELLSPVRALLHSRAALSQSIFQDVEALFASDANRFRKILLDKTTTPLPLGWYLSSASQCAIDVQINRQFYQKQKACGATMRELEGKADSRTQRFEDVEAQIQEDLQPV